jgi:hypothetical protein
LKPQLDDTRNSLLGHAGLTDDVRERIRRRLLSPPPVSSLDEVKRLLSPRPEYIGPGPWLALLKSLRPRGR